MRLISENRMKNIRDLMIQFQAIIGLPCILLVDVISVSWLSSIKAQNEDIRITLIKLEFDLFFLLSHSLVVCDMDELFYSYTFLG